MIGGLSYETLTKLYENIKRNYPDTLSWIKHKAAWEHIPLFSVIIDYHDHIKRLMKQEDSER